MFDKQGVLPENVYLDAIDNTNKMADSVEAFNLDTSFKYPKLYDDEEAVFKKRINEMYLDKLNRGIITNNPKYISQIKGDSDVRDNVRKEFGDNIKFKGEKDKGNCTKAITVSLYNLQKKFGLNIFPNLDDIEKIAHPKDLIEYLKPYVKEAPSGELKDIPDVKVGDIFIFTNGDNEPGHAMMCYEFNEEKEPLVLGFSNNANGYNGFYNAFYSDKSHPQKGRILDAWSLIKDAYHQKYNAKENIPTIPSKER